MAEMSVFESRECKRTRELLDHFLCGELSVETNQDILSHLNQCTACREEKRSRADARKRVSDAWRSQAVPAGLQQKVMARVGDGRRPMAPMLRRVAGFLLVGLGSAGLLWVLSPLGNVGLLMAVNHYQEVAADHVECAGHRAPPSFLLPLQQIQNELIELIGQQDSHYRLMEVRVCRKGEANLVHYAFQGDSGGTLSLMLEQGVAGERLFLSGDEPRRRLGGLDVSLVREGSTTLAAFQTDRYRVYLVAEEVEADALFGLADQIIPSLRSVL